MTRVWPSIDFVYQLVRTVYMLVSAVPRFSLEISSFSMTIISLPRNITWRTHDFNGKSRDGIPNNMGRANRPKIFYAIGKKIIHIGYSLRRLQGFHLKKFKIQSSYNY